MHVGIAHAKVQFIRSWQQTKKVFTIRAGTLVVIFVLRFRLFSLTFGSWIFQEHVFFFACVIFSSLLEPLRGSPNEIQRKIIDNCYRNYFSFVAIIVVFLRKLKKMKIIRKEIFYSIFFKIICKRFFYLFSKIVFKLIFY